MNESLTTRHVQLADVSEAMSTNCQATKGAWWMPWRQKAMKDVVSCDKPRGAANKL